jgi:hypothetical protein
MPDRRVVSSSTQPVLTPFAPFQYLHQAGVTVDADEIAGLDQGVPLPATTVGSRTPADDGRGTWVLLHR